MRIRLLALLTLLLLAAPAPAADDLSARIRHLLRILTGEQTEFDIQVHVATGKEEATLIVRRKGDEAFRFELRHPKYPVELIRKADRTDLVIHRRRRIIRGVGAVAVADSLRPKGLARRILSRDSRLWPWWQSLGVLRLVDRVDPDTVAGLLRGLLALDGERFSIQAGESAYSLVVTLGDVRITISPAPPFKRHAPSDDIYVGSSVDRAEMERSILRAVRRAGEAFLPGARLIRTRSRSDTVPGGRLDVVSGHRMVMLSGTPAQVGRAHGLLLAKEMRRCIDSTVHLAGLGYTIEKGDWFPDVLRRAWKRLAPHIPRDHLVEMDAMADAAGIDRETARLANVFPELFHCSGFAVFGRATAGGKLYHGRVLDYMTMVGLQDAATVFVVAVDGKRAFVNVGYAGFIGSVTGMNEKKLSLGEMGGRGEGNWDGVPMAILMRRALEECDTLSEVIRLWRESPRTCEYYYVVADGKIPDAVAVEATPSKFEVLRSGADHDRLGPGIPDAVVLSSGGRLAELRRRVLAAHGGLDAAAAIRLMARPVAMRSNLHNALLVPQDLVLWVAHADHERPAAECGYTEIDFGKLLATLPGALEVRGAKEPATGVPAED